MAREFIDMGPVSWRQALPIYLASIENGSGEGRRMAIEDLGKMAKVADLGVHSQYLEDAAAFERDGDLEQAKEMRVKAERYAKAARLEIEEVAG